MSSCKGKCSKLPITVTNRKIALHSASWVKKKKLFFPESHLHPPPPDHPLWPISIVISGRSSEHMACQSSPALRGSPHPNPLGRPCIIHHVLETTRQLSTNAAAGEKREEEKQRKPPRKRNRKEAGKDEAQH